VLVDGDLPLFIDPFAISQRIDRWSQECHRTLVAYFERVVHAIKDGELLVARELLLHLREPNETRLGLSRDKPQGAGIGRYQSEQLYNALKLSAAVKTGFLNFLEESELLIEGISFDKISDLTTNVIRGHLAEYTKQQCNLFGIPTYQVSIGSYYSFQAGDWLGDYFDLPVIEEKPVLLVPKMIARYTPSYVHPKYYNHFVLKYLQEEHLNAGSNLVRTLKNQNRVVYKKDLKAIFPCTKEFLYSFSKNHPEVMQQYREFLEKMEKKGKPCIVEPEDEPLVADALITMLSSINSGSDGASEYHNFMIGLVEFIFFPNLIYPQKEREIHQGRKRIDIVMENGANDGVFNRLHQIRKLPCAFVAFECKNYTTEIANPELDQIAGRFSPNRGLFGILCCRQFQDRQKFIERCRDTFKDSRGLIVPLDDHIITKWLHFIKEKKREFLDEEMSRLIDEVWLD
jgi:hypothetical protein